MKLCVHPFVAFAVRATLNLASIRCHILQPFQDNNYFNNTTVKVPKKLCNLRNCRCNKQHPTLFPIDKIELVLVKPTAGAGNLTHCMKCVDSNHPDYWVYDFKLDKLYQEDLEIYKKIKHAMSSYKF